MKLQLRHILAMLLIFLLSLTALAGCGETGEGTGAPETEPEAVSEAADPAGEDVTWTVKNAAAIDEEGTYTSRDEVALYLYTYDHLPDNFITKKEAQALGWEGGSLEPYAPGKCIGGDRFGNYEGILPEDNGETYHECDIDTLGKKSRGAKRLVWSDDGDIYYTEDHYETFVQIY